MKLQFTVKENENNMLLRDFLKNRGVSLTLLRSVKTHGGYFCNGQGIYTNANIKSGQKIEFTLKQTQSENVQPQNMPLDVVFENEHAMLLNKPHNMAVHPTFLHPDTTLANAFCGFVQKRGQSLPFRAINRIDRDTSGLVLCAMNEYSAPLLASGVEKIYLAIVQGKAPASGEINLPIGLKDGSFITRCVRDDGKQSVTKYKTLWQENGYSLVAVRPVTGRTHQIRVHFSHMGYPLAGDDMYGGSVTDIARQALHCGLMEFDDIAKKYDVTFINRDSKLIENTCSKTKKSTATHRNGKIAVLCPLNEDMARLVPNYTILDEELKNLIF